MSHRTENPSVAVVGTVCLDEIRRPGMQPVRGLGGLFYSVITLAQLFDKSGTVCPFCKIGEDDFDLIGGEFDRYPAIDMSYTSTYPGRNNTVVLDYYSSGERNEYSTNRPKPFSAGDLAPVSEMDMALVNFISGREMNRQTFLSLKNRLKVPMYVDLHSLFLGIGKNGRRFYIEDRDWSEWHISGDIVQMNECEAGILAGRKLDGADDFREFGRYLLDKGAEVVVITLADCGCVVSWKSMGKTMFRAVPAYSSSAVEDPTGCGDVFGAAFVFRYLEGGDPAECAGFAVKVAGVRAAQKHSADLHRLRSILQDENIFINTD